jgi:hypothetical protein
MIPSELVDWRGGYCLGRHLGIDGGAGPADRRQSPATAGPARTAPSGAAAALRAAATTPFRLRLGAGPLGVERAPRAMGLGVRPMGAPQRPLVGGRTRPVTSEEGHERELSHGTAESVRAATGGLTAPPTWVRVLLGIVLVGAGIVVLADLALVAVISTMFLGAVAVGAFEVLHAFWTKGAGGLPWKALLGACCTSRSASFS